MALSININVNNSDISIKNSKTGAKKNIKSISAGNLNDMTDREFNISQKRKIARKQAMKLISDAWDKDNKAAQGIKDMESEKADIANINADLKSKLKDIDKSQKDLQELYGVHSESQEQKDLELLKKYQDNRNGVSNDKFSKEEIDRLKELQNEPLTEYQKKALMINSSKDVIRSQIDQNALKAMNKTMSINNAKLEQLKSQDMLKAGDAADSIIEAADKDIFGMLVNEGKQNIDDNMKEQQEEAKKAEEEKEKKQEQIDEAGMTAECLEECDDLILWFSEGKYVYLAMELKMKYKPLTPLQQEKYDSRPGAVKKKPEPEKQPESTLEEVDDEKAQAIRKFLSGLLEQMESAAEIHIYLLEKGRYKVILEGKNLGALIGRRGETLDAIQQLTSYAVNRSGSGRVRVQLDAENYREKREQSLQHLARKVAAKVTKYRRSVTLEPMNAYERHVIHTALQDVPNVTTYSTGTEPNRRVIVAYDREKK